MRNRGGWDRSPCPSRTSVPDKGPLEASSYETALLDMQVPLPDRREARTSRADPHPFAILAIDRRCTHRWETRSRRANPHLVSVLGIDRRCAHRRKARAGRADANLFSVLAFERPRTRRWKARTRRSDAKLAAVLDLFGWDLRRQCVDVHSHLCLQLLIAPGLASIQLRVGTDS
jgi:hypothetical protein